MMRRYLSAVGEGDQMNTAVKSLSLNEMQRAARDRSTSSRSISGVADAQREVLRAVNDGILNLARLWDLDGCPASFRCECGRPGCAEIVSLLPSEYTEARRSIGVSIVAPSHESICEGRVVRRVARRAVFVACRDSGAA